MSFRYGRSSYFWSITIHGTETVATSFPTFTEVGESLQATMKLANNFYLTHFIIANTIATAAAS
ncbi:hypothetical protein ABVN80_21725 [Acinetobacter baumannii]